MPSHEKILLHKLFGGFHGNSRKSNIHLALTLKRPPPSSEKTMFLLTFSFSISYDDDYYYDSDHFDTDHHHEDHQRGRNLVIDIFSKRSDLSSSGL